MANLDLIQNKFDQLLNSIEEGKINFSKNYNPIGALESAYTQLLNLKFKHTYYNFYNTLEYITADSFYNCFYSFIFIIY